MASSSMANLFSFFAPPKPPPFKTPPPSQLSLSAASSSCSSRSKDGLPAEFDALSLSNDNQQYSLTTSSSVELMPVVCPSLAYSNTLYFKSAYNVQVIVDDNEPEEKLLNRFHREVMRAGVIQECKRRKFYENKQDEKKRKSREAARRNRRRRPQLQSRSGPSQDREETFLGSSRLETSNRKNEDEDEDEDNWDMPEGDLPL